MAELFCRQKEVMRIDAEKKLFTTDDFSKMYAAGILDNDERVELVDGEIIKLNPGKRHVACTLRATAVFTKAFGDRACVSIQNPIVIDIYNEPKPDVVVLKAREDFYASTEPAPEHALLIIEISDTTVAMDRKRKLPKYAQNGVPEYWIEDLKNDCLHVYRDPAGNEYKTHLIKQRGDSISPLGFPDILFRVEELLG
jgi:Uma2 family endonuclease